jgi:hypothetical protein
MIPIGRRAWHPSLNFHTMRLTHAHLAELEATGIVALRDDEPPASLTELALLVSLNRLGMSAARHAPPRCPDCAEDLPEHHNHSGVCDECAARGHELT